MIEQGAGANRRDPDNYYVTIFGTPAEKGTWGYRVEAPIPTSARNRLARSSNGTIVDAPSFFGSNPAEVRIGPRKGLRVLARRHRRLRLRA